MKCTWQQGDRAVVTGSDEHGTVVKVRMDSNSVPLVDLELDSGESWVARTFELREESEEEFVEICSNCGASCNGDVTIADHGVCKDCHHETLNETEDEG